MEEGRGLSRKDLPVMLSYRNVIDNTLYIEKNIKGKKKWCVFVYNLFMILFCPRRNESTPIVHVINGRSEFRTRNFFDSVDIYYGLTFSNLRDLKDQKCHVSYIGRSRRLFVLFQSFLLYPRLRIKRGCFSYWLDYCLWNTYITIQKPKTIISNGHYDRLTTTLSELCKLHSVEFRMKQHGLLANKYDLPHKIICDKVYAFDDIQAVIFREYIIGNQDCQYEMWYQAGFEFVNKDFKRFSIGIIENKSKEIREIYDILEAVKKYCRKYDDVYIMLHPLSDQMDYKDIMASSICSITFTREKIFDFDMIISTPSTLAYDYLRADYKKPIIFADFKLRMRDVFSKYENVLFVDSADRLNEKLAEIMKL